MSALLNEDDLKNWTGFEQRKKLEDFLRLNKISFTYGKGNRIVTTQGAIDRALNGETAANDNKDAFF